MTYLVSSCSPAAFHICPDVRIAAGIDASMITSLGTCRLVMPRSESTIAIDGPAAIAACTALVASGCALSRLPSPSFGLTSG